MKERLEARLTEITQHAPGTAVCGDGDQIAITPSGVCVVGILVHGAGWRYRIALSARCVFKPKDQTLKRSQRGGRGGCFRAGESTDTCKRSLHLPIFASLLCVFSLSSLHFFVTQPSFPDSCLIVKGRRFDQNGCSRSSSVRRKIQKLKFSGVELQDICSCVLGTL